MWFMTLKTWGWRRYILELTRIALGAVFVGSGLAKLQQPFDFLSNVYSYQLVGPDLGYAVAFALPWLEFVLGVCLLGGVLPAGGLLLTTLLLAVFTAVKASAVHRQLQIGCGCQVISAGEILGVGDVALTFLVTVVSAAAYVGVLVRLRGGPINQPGCPWGFLAGPPDVDYAVRPFPSATPGRIG